MRRLWRIVLGMAMVMVLGAGSALAASAGHDYLRVLDSLPRVGSYVSDMPGYTCLLQRKGYEFSEFHGKIGAAAYQEQMDSYGRIASLRIIPRQQVSLTTEEAAGLIHKLSSSYGRPSHSEGDKLIWDGRTGYTGSLDTQSGALDLHLAK